MATMTDKDVKKFMDEIAENTRRKIRESKEKEQKQDSWCEEQIEEIFKTAFGEDQYQAILQAPLETPPRWPSLYKEDGKPNVEGLKDWITSEFEQLKKEMEEENRNMEKFVEKVDRQCEEVKEDMARRGEELTREINKITECHQRTEAIVNEKLRKFKEDMLEINRPAEELLSQITKVYENTKKFNKESFDRYLETEREIEAMEEAIESETYEMKVEESYKSGLVPKWTHPSLSKVRYTVTPIYRTIKGFEEKKGNNEEIITEPFYTTRGGYKMKLKVDPNGYGHYKGSHVSVFIHLMKGDNDNVLAFPFTGNVIVQALNWNEDNGHVERIIQFDESTPLDIRQRATDGETAEAWGFVGFLPHLDLPQYLHNDMMCLRVSFEDIHRSGSPVPRWCNSEINSPILPCTVTMYQYSQFKKTNSIWNSRPFYTSERGYKLQLVVRANGHGSGNKGTHVSVYVYLMKGEYDEQLQWPFNASITLQLLNWSCDSDHIEGTIPYYEAPMECHTRVIDDDSAPGGWGNNFIPHSILSDADSDINYIYEDKLCFKIVSSI